MGLDASAFYAEKYGKTGVTVYTAYNHGSPYDPSGIDLTAIPQFNRFTLNPKFYAYLGERTTLSLGLNAMGENRIGGDIHFVKGNGGAGHSFFEKNKTDRYSTQFEFTHAFDERRRITVKNSLSYYNRDISLPGYRFSGIQHATYSEANMMVSNERTDWVAGINYLTDNFQEQQLAAAELRNYREQTIGGFVQNTWNIGTKFILESGLRGDYHHQYGFFFLPRISALIKFNEAVSSRLGGGLGYKVPNVFTEEAERIQFKDILPVNTVFNKAERSFGLNYDIEYRTPLLDGKAVFTINQLFFYTRINDPMRLTQEGTLLRNLQPDGDLNTKGLETNMKLIYGDFKLFVGYTFAHVTQHTGATTSVYPLVSKHRLNNVLMYEVENKWKLGAEAYYFGPQLLNDGQKGKSYWTTGFMAEKFWKQFSLFINFENFTDTRQTRFDTVFTGTIARPEFRDIYAPMDGFVINGGIKIKL